MTKKNCILLLTMACLLSLPFTAYAAEKIKSINLKIEAEFADDEATPDLDITTKTSRYTVDGYEVLNDLEDEEEDSGGGPGAKTSTSKSKSKSSEEVFSCEITLTAEKNYVFNTMKKSDIKLSGLESSITKATRKDSGKTLVLTVEIPGIKKSIRNVEHAAWQSPGKAVWTEAKNATNYVLRLYKDGKLKGTYETGGTVFDFSPAILKEGSYSYTVRAMDGDNGSKERAESELIYIPEDQVNINRERYALQYDDSVEMSGPSDQTSPINTGWQQEGDKYWYRLNNGMYPQMNWLQLGSDWYFFDENGYLVTDSTITWKGKNYSFDSSGKMR
jgi:glucan-binding YG repeat protein